MSIEQPRVIVTNPAPGLTQRDFSPSRESTILTPRESSPITALARRVNPFAYMSTTSLSPVVKQEHLREAWEDVRDWYEALPPRVQRQLRVEMCEDFSQITITPKSALAFRLTDDFVGTVSNKYSDELEYMRSLSPEKRREAGFRLPGDVIAEIRAERLARTL
ncbi:MAG: hypothetical protein LVQ95_04065 [Candidatus Micrarchaeales archaeon]|nr:hypothetical protein [Candidatus Micrarchaeales archaeon]